MLVAKQIAYVQDFTVVKTANGETRYDPVIATVEPGVLMDVGATVSADRKFVTLALRPKVAALVEMTSLP